MAGISLITKGMIVKKSEEGDITKIIYPLTIDMENRKPKIIISPIRKTISLNVKSQRG